MKRSSDFGSHSQDSTKKARFGQNYSYPSLPGDASNIGLSHPAGSTSDLYSQYPLAHPLMMPSQYPQGMAQYPGAGQYGNLAQLQGMGSYGAAVGQYPGAQGRTIYIGNVPADTSVDEVLNQVKGGPVENIRILPEKNCIFISFLDGTSAATFYHEASTRKLSVKGQDLKVGWGKPSPVPNSVLVAVQSGASRNVFLGSLDETITEEKIKEDLSVFGPIDTIRILREKNIGFVHFLSISNAVKCVSTLQSDPQWAGKRVNYGKDRCAQTPKSFHNMGFPVGAGMNAMGYPGFPGAYGGMGFDPYSTGADPTGQAGYLAAGYGGMNPVGNRTIYLGNIHPETTCEDICNVVRGGILHQIRFMADKHIAFVSFIDPIAAMNFFNLANYSAILVKNRRLKVGWGKNTPLPPAVAMAVQSGATRNVYIGNIDESIDEEKLRQDFSAFGDIELVNMLKDKNCAFVNFTNILSAVKAIDGIKSNPDYSNFRVNYGKDRCGNPPRPPKSSAEADLSGGFPSGNGDMYMGTAFYDAMAGGAPRGV
ncbi:hypothetical protein K493DRAFT_319674 [Basidiobolus meristosporus CBS 931.73]|uniref:RRM domain-containing protein n=1 Tax=Basidiobolus meristosporus CBS 931.73 TaxID=1314790 RepID=A0A1Y1XNV0_9FUNG|nr:hypothetical protein K493DRAFT_319674 [Basidiobolus meristosporus CBS 931.73]|eukprot:ORX87345.1 hypothetical protein K493DRAFT_319674 [Basidiobolus meristosporus CBS 931.73]